MKLLFDFLPILLFFATFKYAEGHKDWAAAFATEHLGFMVAGGQVGTTEAPVLLSTVVVIFASLAQVAWLKSRGKKVDLMLWISVSVITIFGCLTIYFHNAKFLMWKPTIIYWLQAAAFLIALFGFKKNLIREVMQAQIKLPDPVWTRLCLAWIVFFIGIGLLNLLAAFVIFAGNTDAWVNFKTFGMTGLLFAFFVGQTFYLSKYIEEEKV